MKRFVGFDQVAETFRGKTVAVVGGGPSSLDNRPGFIDGHDVVVRINNYKTGAAQGKRCDVFYSFFGNSIKKPAHELMRDGVRLCMAKCPDAKPIESRWHELNGKIVGVDFRYIYEMRRGWWWCDTYVPDVATFIERFELLDRHIPTTGFSAILDVLACAPKCAFLTGFDFFSSGLHNVDENWRPGDPRDPIGHRPDLEAAWLAANAEKHLLMLDPVLSRMLNERRVA